MLDVTDVTSDSIEGLSDIELHFAPGTGLYTARQLVQERLTGAFVLPNVSKPPVMVQPMRYIGGVPGLMESWPGRSRHLNICRPSYGGAAW